MLDISDIAEGLRSAMGPIEHANGLPSPLYTSADGYALERTHLFHANWTCIAYGKDVPHPGDAKPIDFLGAPLLLLRDHAGAVKVYENVCRHRGMILVDAPRNFGGVIRCPYHSWCYSLDGKLRATPHVGGPGVNKHESIDPEQTGLNPVRAVVWMDCVFVDMSGTAPDFDDWIAPLAHRWSDFMGKSLYAGAGSSFTLDVHCNWKLAIENYCESYHLPWVHPGLNSYSKLEDHYHIEQPGTFSGQGTVVYNPQLSETQRFPDFADLPQKWDTGAEYVSLFPNLMLGIHRDHMFAIRLDPMSHDRTIENVDIWYTTEEAATSDAYAELRATNAAMWKSIFIEDITVVEGMQKGRHAPQFDGGRFSAVMDSPTHVFHAWVAQKLHG
jgi:choline monooxygenase